MPSRPLRTVSYNQLLTLTRQECISHDPSYLILLQLYLLFRYRLVSLHLDRTALFRTVQASGQDGLDGALVLDKFAVDKRLFSLVIVEAIVVDRRVQLTVRRVNKRASGCVSSVQEHRPRSIG